MAGHTSVQFDFDDWAGLYLENPEEFEARRKAVLLIELTRGTASQCAQGRALLDAYEKRAQGCDSQQRMHVAASMMMESARELNTELMLLKKAVHELDDENISAASSEPTAHRIQF